MHHLRRQVGAARGGPGPQHQPQADAQQDAAENAGQHAVVRNGRAGQDIDDSGRNKGLLESDEGRKPDEETAGRSDSTERAGGRPEEAD